MKNPFPRARSNALEAVLTLNLSLLSHQVALGAIFEAHPLVPGFHERDRALSLSFLVRLPFKWLHECARKIFSCLSPSFLVEARSLESPSVFTSDIGGSRSHFRALEGFFRVSVPRFWSKPAPSVFTSEIGGSRSHFRRSVEGFFDTLWFPSDRVTKPNLGCNLT